MESLDLYKQYLYERENAFIHYARDKKDDLIGFAIYCFNTDKELCCYIKDIYVVKEHRNKGVAALMADEIALKAKNDGYEILMGSVDTTTNHSKESMGVLISYGMSPCGISGNLVYFKKDIGG